MRNLRFVVIALMSITLIALELVWTRMFSAEFFYTFAFLTLSLAVMGLGMGALVVRLFPALDGKHSLGTVLSLAGLMSLLGPILLFQIDLNFTHLLSSWAMTGKFILTVLLLSSTFVCGGIALALIFKNNHQDMPSLYMADLLGAGVGVLVAIWLMNGIGTPITTFLIALPILGAALLTARRWIKVLPLVLMALAVILCFYSPQLLEVDRQERAPVIYKHWDAMAKIKLYDYGGYGRGIEIDNVANSPVYLFDGVWDADDTTDNQWGIDVSYLIDRFDSCTFLSLGAGGGSDVLQALAEGATDIRAVEVNSHINYMMVHGDTSGYIEPPPAEPDTAVAETPAETSAEGDSTDTEVVPDTSETQDATEGTAEDSTVQDSSGEDEAAEPPAPPPPPPPVIRDSTGQIITLAKYSGHIYSDPRVEVVTEDARAYIRCFKNEFDVVYSLSSNTWAALGSGSFALAENYLFTTEAFIDYWEALSDSGFLSMEHQVYMPRLVSELIDALDELGVEDPTSHFAVYDLPQMRRKLLLLSKQPLTDEIRNFAYGELTDENYDAIHLLYPAPDSLADNLINQIVLNGWENMTDSAKVDISPCTDDRPFVAQMGLWRNFGWDLFEKGRHYGDFYGLPLSKTIIVIILAVVVIIIVPLNLIPYFMKGEKLKAGPWLYFFAIGMAFMSVEIILIQKYALFIGASVYSIATVLLTLLIASGIGSRFARKIGDHAAFLGILTFLVLNTFLFDYVTAGLYDLTMFSRVLVTAVLVFPLGFFMGMPFPKGALRVRELIDWGFAVNGAASVLGSTLIVMAAFYVGFTMALLFGGALYLMAYLLMSVKSAWR